MTNGNNGSRITGEGTIVMNFLENLLRGCSEDSFDDGIRIDTELEPLFPVRAARSSRPCTKGGN